MGEGWKSPLESTGLLEWGKIEGSMEDGEDHHSFREMNHVPDRLAKLEASGKVVFFENKKWLLKDILGAIWMDQAGLHVI